MLSQLVDLRLSDVKQIKGLEEKHSFLLLTVSLIYFFPCPFPFSFFLFCSSWLVVSLTWKWTSSSRMQRPSSACWSCWNTVKSHARRKSGACLPPSCARVSATCRPALRSASFRGYCSKWALWMTWLQVSGLNLTLFQSFGIDLLWKRFLSIYPKLYKSFTNCLNSSEMKDLQNSQNSHDAVFFEKEDFADCHWKMT